MAGDAPRKSNPAPPNALERALVRRIRRDGPLRFGEFMRAALYDPELGYYTSGRRVWGSQGDYLTAPAVHPALGGSVARVAVELDAALGRPAVLDLVEHGCGDGRLAAAVAAALREEAPATWERVRMTLVEPGARAREAALERVPAPPGGLTVVAPDDEEARRREAGCGLVYSNELLDALPVERVRRVGGRLRQSQVQERGGRLAEVFAEPVDDEVRAHLERNTIRLADGQTAEVCPAVADWLDTVASRLDRGGVLTVDYGHETRPLYGPSRPHGTLVTMRRFALGDDPLADPGERDLTAHVDFGNLTRLGGERGFVAAPVCSLRVFLIGWGAAAGVADAADPAERLALRHLLVSEIGDAHRVHWMTRGLPAGALRFGRDRLEDPS